MTIFHVGFASFATLSLLSPHASIVPLILLCVFAFFKQRKKIRETLAYQMNANHMKDFLSTSPLKVGLILFSIWSCVSVFWSTQMKDSLSVEVSVLLILLCIYIFKLYVKNVHIDPKAIFVFFVFSFFVVLFGAVDNGFQLKIMETWRSVSPAKAYTQTALIHILLIWVCVGFLNLSKYIFIFYIFILFLLTKYADCDTSFLGLCVGVPVFLIAYHMPRLIFQTFRYGMLIMMLLMPLLSLTLTDQRIDGINTCVRDGSIIHRLQIWHSVAEQVLQKPFIGFGMNASRHREDVITSKKNYYILHENNEMRLNDAPPEKCIHPHNVILQLWLELGGVGVSIISIILFALWTLIQNIQSQKRRASAMAFFVTAQIIGFFSVGMWQSWWLMTFGFFITLFLYGKLKEDKV